MTTTNPDDIRALADRLTTLAGLDYAGHVTTTQLRIGRDTLAALVEKLDNNRAPDHDTVTVTDSWRVSIVTKYHGPTNNRGSRISVTANGAGRKRIYVEYRHDLNIGDNHAEAVRQYAQLMGWAGRWITGGTDTGAVAVWAGYETRPA